MERKTHFGFSSIIADRKIKNIGDGLWRLNEQRRQSIAEYKSIRTPIPTTENKSIHQLKVE